MPDLDTMLQDFASFIEEELPPPDVETVLSAAAMPPAMPRRWLRPVLVAAASAMLVLVAVGLPFLFLSGDESIVDDEPTTTVASTTLPPTTMPPTTVASTTTVAPTTTPPTTVQPTPAAPAEVVPFPPSEFAALEVPLSEAIPGFTDTIVMSAWSVDGFGVIRWRSSESMPELLLAPERNRAGWADGLDASARWVAQIFFDDDVLTVQAVPTVPGEPSRREIVGHDVHLEARSPAVWHDTEPGRLAWLECPNFLDGPTTLVTLNTSDPSADPIRVGSFDRGCATSWGEDESDAAKPVVWLERWDSTGVWVTKFAEDAEGRDVRRSVIVDADGTETPVASDASMIARSPDGRSIWEPAHDYSVPGQADPPYLSSTDGQHRSTVPGLADGSHLYGAWWSPDGTRLAMWLNTDGGRRSGEEMLRTVDSMSGEVITEIAEPALDGWGPTLAWSTDSRFLVYKEVPRTDTAVLVIHDTATNTTTKIPLSEDIDDIRVR